MTFAGKIKRLEAQLRGYGKILIAFSGGKDSFFLLKTAMATLSPKNVFAYFVQTPLVPASSHKRISYFKKMLGFKLHKINLNLLTSEPIRRNAKDRCFHCKTRMFQALKADARRLKISTVVDGSTLSDLSEYRPGRLALERQGIISPLQQAGVTSDEIARFLKKKGIGDYYVTPGACLATRFPYNRTLNRTELARIEKIEGFLVSKNIFPLRVRHMENGIRIETAIKNFPLLLNQRESILSYCQALKIKFITLDLAGIKRGSWD